jgi:hypothetical protein
MLENTNCSTSIMLEDNTTTPQGEVRIVELEEEEDDPRDPYLRPASPFSSTSHPLEPVPEEEKEEETPMDIDEEDAEILPEEAEDIVSVSSGSDIEDVVIVPESTQTYAFRSSEFEEPEERFPVGTTAAQLSQEKQATLQAVQLLLKDEPILSIGTDIPLEEPTVTNTGRHVNAHPLETYDTNGILDDIIRHYKQLESDATYAPQGSADITWGHEDARASLAGNHFLPHLERLKAEEAITKVTTAVKEIMSEQGLTRKEYQNKIMEQLPGQGKDLDSFDHGQNNAPCTALNFGCYNLGNLSRKPVTGKSGTKWTTKSKNKQYKDWVDAHELNESMLITFLQRNVHHVFCCCEAEGLARPDVRAKLENFVIIQSCDQCMAVGVRGDSSVKLHILMDTTNPTVPTFRL